MTQSISHLQSKPVKTAKNGPDTQKRSLFMLSKSTHTRAHTFFSFPTTVEKENDLKGNFRIFDWFFLVKSRNFGENQNKNVVFHISGSEFESQISYTL